MNKQLDFTRTTIYCGVDVHKKSWRVNIQDSEFELEDFTQNADAVLLHKHLKRRYPNATFKIGYEAGFSGFTMQRVLSSLGSQCLVINAADIPSGDKEKKRKQDKIDARKLCDHLQSRKVNSIYIPDSSWEHARTLVRTRERIVNNQTRSKNRIWQLLHFSGLTAPLNYEQGRYWSRRFIAALQQMDCGGDAHLQTALQLHIKDYLQTRSLLLEATRAIRKLCKEANYQHPISLLRTIPGIGEINAAVILFELQDIKRFKRFDHLSSYAGLVPDTEDSGDTKRSKGITRRSNYYLRVALVESSWNVVRKDPALLMKYKEYCKKMDRNKAIIRIAKHLLARIRYVLLNQKEYVIGVVV
ncbi:MAG: IS110 family transposase [Chitinophagaceae bacterium]